jgi:hypothetical protein
MLMTSVLGLFVLFADKFKTFYLKKLSVAIPDPTEEPETRPHTPSPPDGRSQLCRLATSRTAMTDQTNSFTSPAAQRGCLDGLSSGSRLLLACPRFLQSLIDLADYRDHTEFSLKVEP